MLCSIVEDLFEFSYVVFLLIYFSGGCDCKL